MSSRTESTRSRAHDWDALAEVYDRAYDNEYTQASTERDLLDQLIGYVDRRLPVVDLGCGPGNATRYLTQHNLTAIGVDLSARMLSIARRRNPNVTFRRTDLARIDWPPASLGGAVSLFSIIQLPPIAALDLIARVSRALAPGTAFLLVTHAGHGIHHSRNVLDQDVDLDLHLYSATELVDMFEGAGLVIVATNEHVNTGTALASDMARAVVLGRKPKVGSPLYA